MGKKKRMGQLLTGMVLVALVSILVAACGIQQEGTEPMAGGESDGKALVEERCSTCHDLARITSAKKTRDEWQANVERMVDKGAQLSAEEQAVVIDYLTEAYPK